MKDISINNIENNQLELTKIEAEEAINLFKKSIEEDINHFSKFTSKNLDELIKMIFDSCQDITEIEFYINKLKEIMIKEQDKKERLIYQKDLTRKDIINNNIYNIYAVYSATAISSLIFTNNPISQIQNFILLTAIQLFAFKVNLDYFTSDKYKQKIMKTVKEIDEAVDINNYNVNTLNTFRNMYIYELELLVSKLYNIISKRKNFSDVNDKISILLKDMNIEFILEDKSIPVKRRKR